MSSGTSRVRSSELALNFQYIGAHYSSCPVEIRELWTQAFDSETGRKRLADVVASVIGTNRPSLVPIFTCNRFDLCLETSLSESDLHRLFAAICRQAADELASRSHSHTMASRPGLHRGPRDERAGRVSEQSLTELRALAAEPGRRLGGMVRMWHGHEALRHLFRVACSLDSLVLGEPHILGQLKEELAKARELSLSSPLLENLFGHAFGVAKRVRTETELGRNAVSIGHASVTLAARIFEELSRHSILIIGAGEMARLAAQHVVTRGVNRLTVANRTRERARSLVTQIGHGESTDLKDALSRLHDFDVVIVATASRELLIEEQHVQDVPRLRRGQASVLIDISVPRNVSPACADVSQDLFVFDIDDLEKVMDYNRERRRDAAARAERVIDEVLQNFVQKSHERDKVQVAATLHRLIYSTVLGELERTLSREGSVMTAEQADIIARAVAKRLAAGPSLALRRGEVAEAEALAAIGRLFPALGCAGTDAEPGEEP